jgi:hypothetical protein
MFANSLRKAEKTDRYIFRWPQKGSILLNMDEIEMAAAVASDFR